MRLFTALDPPDAVSEHLAALQSPSALDARWSPPSQFHVTLRFIGDTEPDRAARYEEALAKITLPPVECIPHGLDALPSRRSPRVLVVGLERTNDLLALYRSVSDALEREGLAPDEQTYRPHVTLARLNDDSPEAVHRFIRTHDAASLPSFEVSAFFLYESILTPDGARHQQRASFSLVS